MKLTECHNFGHFHDFNLQKGSLKGNITLTKTLFVGPMVKNHDKNDDHNHEMSRFTFEMLMSIKSKRHQKISVGIANGHS